MQIMGILFTFISFAIILLYLLSKEKNLTGKDQWDSYYFVSSFNFDFA